MVICADRTKEKKLFYVVGLSLPGRFYLFVGCHFLGLTSEQFDRDMSQDLIFLPLRDHSGVTQLVYRNANDENLRSQIQSLSTESVVCVEGIVRKRPDGMSNKKQSTGDVEVEISKIYCLNPATPNLPFWPSQATLVKKRKKKKLKDESNINA